MRRSGFLNVRKMNSSLKYTLFFAVAFTIARAAIGKESPTPPQNVRALSRQLRVDIVWDSIETPLYYEVRRARKADGAFEPLPAQLTNANVNAYCDFIGESGSNLFYKVRSVRRDKDGNADAFSDWSAVCHASPLPLETSQLVTEVQEAGFRYFYDYGHPVSGLARVGTRKKPDVCSSGSVGWAMHNIVVGVERGFITREQAVQRAAKMLRFLSSRADRFHGAFPHWLDGATGRTIPFSQYDDGADIVETAYLMEGVLLLREYFSSRSAGEKEIRRLADFLWRSVEWTWFAQEQNGRNYLLWHWSPNYGWFQNHAISGFNECQIVYVLALASPTHPVSPKCYWQGWQSGSYANPRTEFGISLELGRDIGPPLFWTEYSYLGFDPCQISFHGKTYFEHFQNFCRVDLLYAKSRSDQFKGYGPLWGWTAGYGPSGYKAYAPGPRDDGTINPSAALSSMPYVPEDSRAFLAELYVKHGRDFWGPFGFYDAFNLSRDWLARDYLANEVGPIGPMIENSRSGICWKTFMQAPEIAVALKIISSPP